LKQANIAAAAAADVKNPFFMALINGVIPKHGACMGAKSIRPPFDSPYDAIIEF
jgi:hypothetical protein